MSQEHFVIVGTAGHIDHGKTTLVKALTGKETDTFKEEKERGISIDIGFAPFTLPDGRRIGVVDVPGHERFIKNMLAGAGGIDLILLVIDANEGIMPQTTEHLHIVEMLHVQKGIVVLTKIDTVEEEWLELVTEEIKEGLKDSILADAPIVPVSAYQGTGIDQLRDLIGEMALQVKPREVQAPFRLPIDRVFSVPGFGTVVTGTIGAGKVQVGDTLEVLPIQEKCRVRSIQVHGESTDAAQAGQRTALNLVGVEKSEISRGYVVAAQGVYKPSQLIDARLRLLSEAPRSLTNKMRIRFYTGTSEILGRVILLDRDELLAGEDALVQFDLESEVVCEPKDHYIIRTYSPMFTLGGGHVIDPHPSRVYRRKKSDILDELQSRETGGPTARVLHALEEEPGLSRSDIAAHMKVTKEQAQSWLDEMLNHGDVLYLPSVDGYVSADGLEVTFDEIEERIRAIYKKERFRLFVPKAQVLSQLSKKVRTKVYDAILSLGEQRGRFVLLADRMQVAGYAVPLSLKEKELQLALVNTFEDKAFQPPAIPDLVASYKGQDRIVLGLISLLKEQGVLVEVEEGIVFISTVIESAKKWATLHGVGDGFTVAEFRDQWGTSRKFAMAILEYLDRIKYTRRVEDKRVVISS